MLIVRNDKIPRIMVQDIHELQRILIKLSQKLSKKNISTIHRFSFQSHLKVIIFEFYIKHVCASLAVRNCITIYSLNTRMVLSGNTEVVVAIETSSVMIRTPTFPRDAEVFVTQIWNTARDILFLKGSLAWASTRSIYSKLKETRWGKILSQFLPSFLSFHRNEISNIDFPFTFSAHV
jgi:hypothetical protein